MKFSGKMGFMIILKVKKKKEKKKQKQEEDTLEVTFFGKTIGRGSPGVFRVYF